MQRVMYPRILVIGTGGGWRTPRDLAFFLSAYMPQSVLWLVDGKTYLVRHQDHECFSELGNKANVQVAFLHREFPELRWEAVPNFVGSDPGEGVVPVSELIQAGDVVFLQVDNNKTKLLVDQWCRTLSDITVVSGGTNQDQLRVQAYVRRQGVDLTPPFAGYCADIATPDDDLPSAPCPDPHQIDIPYQSDVRHPFTLMAMSTFMLNTFYQVWSLDRGQLDRLVYDTWHDIRSQRSRVTAVHLDAPAGLRPAKEPVSMGAGERISALARM